MKKNRKIALAIGEWVRFTYHNIRATGQVTRPIHTKPGEEGFFFNVLIGKWPGLELTLKTDWIKDLKKVRDNSRQKRFSNT